MSFVFEKGKQGIHIILCATGRVQYVPQLALVFLIIRHWHKQAVLKLVSQKYNT